MPNYHAKNTMDKKHVIHRMVNKTIFTDNCWLWAGSLRKGHGLIRVNRFSKPEGVHRLSAHFFIGYDFTSDLQINHKRICSNRNCWNPEHLYIGNQQENVIDMIAVGKHRNQYGPCKHTN